jgi:hypothetical protein
MVPVVPRPRRRGRVPVARSVVRTASLRQQLVDVQLVTVVRLDLCQQRSQLRRQPRDRIRGASPSISTASLRASRDRNSTGTRRGC